MTEIILGFTNPNGKCLNVPLKPVLLEILFKSIEAYIISTWIEIKFSTALIQSQVSCKFTKYIQPTRFLSIKSPIAT
jgi:hypothetical protein